MNNAKQRNMIPIGYGNLNLTNLIEIMALMIYNKGHSIRYFHETVRIIIAEHKQNNP